MFSTARSNNSEELLEVSSCGIQSISSDEENISDNSSMQHGV
jgi:hypothetical protein